MRGRASECALLDDLLVAIRRGEGRSLVLRGEAGIGKTALLECLVESASDLTVVRAVGVESDMELAFASLHQLCRPMLDRLERLPTPQREALQVVFGLSPGSAPDRFMVGLAALSLLSEAAEARPLLCVVDDAQWLDRASALTLAFVARRLLAEPVGMAFAAREPGEELQQLPTLEVRGLRNADARGLLSSEFRFVLDQRVRDRIIAETGGNPLALLELPRGLTATQLAGGFATPGRQALSGRIEEGFVRRIAPLPEDTRLLLLIAAAEPVGDPLLLWGAAERLGIAPTAAGTADTEALITIGDRVIFRHPLVRSAVYRSAGAQELRAVHLALAETTDREVDPDRRAWHLAAAATGPDEDVAAELERSASRAQTRGGVVAAAAFLRRAVALTLEPARRVDRALAAARASVQAGAFDSALRLLAAAEAGPLDGFQRAQVRLVRGDVAFASGLGGDAPSLLLRAARALERFDPELARETYLKAWGAGVFSGGDVLLEICGAARALPVAVPRPVDLLLDGLALLITDGHTAAAPRLRRAAEALADISVEDVLQWGWAARAASALIWDADGMLAISARQVHLVRDAGALAQLPLYLSQLALANVWMGDFAGAASLVAEVDSVAAATGSRIAPPYAVLRLRSLQGNEAAAAEVIGGALQQAAARGQAWAASWAHWAAAALYNGLARYEEAASAAEKATFDARNPWLSMGALPELIEAASRLPDFPRARDAFARLERTTQPCGNEPALGIEARCRALLTEGDTADRLYREAIQRLERTPLRPELARAHLLYGEWLRRQNRRVDAREQLRAAHQYFASIGMEAFGERARTELLAIGERVRHRSVETPDRLTSQERQIAWLARDGLTNPEIGARLFLSPRTVEWHLGNAFTKLGIRSRRDLSKALPSPESEPITA